MTSKKILCILLAAGCATLAADAANVKVEMNTTSKTMTFQSKSTGEMIVTGAPAGTVYTFDAPAGEYILTGYASDGTTVNGSIELTVGDTAANEFKVLTCTLYATNKEWTVANGDYTIDATVNTREGKRINTTPGSSTTANRYCMLALNGNSYYVEFIPSAARQAEGYTTLLKAGTLTSNININGAIPLGGDYTVTVPADAELEIGLKKSHFVDFNVVEPKETVINGENKELTYYLAQGQVYSYRTWKDGGLTQGGYFTYAADESKRPQLKFAAADYEAFAPQTVVHDVNHNQGYETGDIFVNVNERGHLVMNPGDTFRAHAMRTWELSDNSTNNYFIEPDFHYTVIDIGGQPSEGVIEITQKPGSAWADIRAVGTGTAIVLVTYDAIGLNYYSGATKTHYMGGEYWSAIWPENTAAYVVTVGEPSSTASPDMFINEEYNKETQKVSGKNVDAEHDVFYYLDTEPGARYTFTPQGVAEVTVAYPQIGFRMATYNGFGSEGVTKNEDGSYTLLLKEGRQIVRMTDAQGHASYQVLTAKPCHREITNASNPGSDIFQPGDKIKIQYSGLRHPANKLAGIYNMSAYVTYNGVPNGSSLILGSGQYTFGSAPSAQAVTVEVPADYDVAANPNIVMDKGVIQVNGYGDPIGNHRIIDNVAGRSPNFTAVAHKTYFGMIPDVVIPVSPYRSFPISVVAAAPGTEVTMTYRGNVLTPDVTTGMYQGSYGEYEIVAKANGYRCYRNKFNINDDADGMQTFHLDMRPLDGAWDGRTLTEPSAADGVYEIGSGAQLAWFAAEVNKGNASVNGRLTADIDLGDFDWTPIGSSSKVFAGNFDGAGYAVSGLYINAPKVNNQGLFGYVKGTSAESPATVRGVAVYGKVAAKQYSAGVAGYIHQYATVERSSNHAEIIGASTYIGGVVGYVGHATASVRDCFNTGDVSGTSNCGGVVGAHAANAVVSNVFNVGTVTGTKVAACVGGTASKATVSNVFAIETYHLTDGHTLVTEEQMASGEIAHRLGEAFGQTLGEQAYPVIEGKKVFKVEYIAKAAGSPVLLLAEEEPAALYTNGKLPELLDGDKVEWYADEAMTKPVSSVEADSMLYAKTGVSVGLEDMNADTGGETRWFTIQGIETEAPSAGAHGIYIRITNGRTEKVFL